MNLFDTSAFAEHPIGVITLSRKPITSLSVSVRSPFFNSIFLIIIDNYSYPYIVIYPYVYCARNWEAGSRKGQCSWRDNRSVQSDEEGGRKEEGLRTYEEKLARRIRNGMMQLGPLIEEAPSRRAGTREETITHPEAEGDYSPHQTVIYE